jgi:hypothetical protein
VTRRGNTSKITGNTQKTGSNTSKTIKSDDAAADADPRRAFYNSLIKLQRKPQVRTLMAKIPEDQPIVVALSSTRPELELLLTPSGFQLRLGKELVGFFELPMFKAPREGLEGFDYEAIHAVVITRAGG